MAALNRQQVEAVVLTGAAVLGLCSCSNATDPGPSVTASPTVEQTVGPATPDPSATLWVTPSPDAAPVAEAAYPALSDPANYVYSDTPQSEGEQWIADNYPEFWEQGIRAVSDTTTAWAFNQADREPAALVQFIGGERYEGTETMPLGFRGQLDDPESYPTDAFAGTKSAFKDPSQTGYEVGNTGEGGYKVAILENPGDQRNRRGSMVTDENDTVLNILRGGEAGHPGGAEAKVFGSWEEAWEYAQENGFVPNYEGARALNKGEVASVVVLYSEMKADGTAGASGVLVLNPTTGEFETVVSR